MAEPDLILWDRGFRPFFLGMGFFAALAIPWWSLGFTGLSPLPLWLATHWWHGHEMVFGFAAAAMAGFLLTAVPNWSGRPAVKGPQLMGLFAIWLAGRLVMAINPHPLLTALVDLLFLPSLALVVLMSLYGTGQWRNYGVVAVLLVLATCNALMHAEAVLQWANTAALGLQLALDFVIVLLLVISGRIVPLFTANALNRRGVSHEIRPSPMFGRIIVTGAILVALSPLLNLPQFTAVISGVTGAGVLTRMVLWQSHRTHHDPLLWSLHLGVIWIGVGLVLKALAAIDLVSPGAATHALTIGAIGGSILAVSTRVCLGHTGRELKAPIAVAVAYLLINLSALTRVLWHFDTGLPHVPMLYLSGSLWSAAFLVFLVCFTPMLLAARVDDQG